MTPLNKVPSFRASDEVANDSRNSRPQEFAWRTGKRLPLSALLFLERVTCGDERVAPGLGPLQGTRRVSASIRFPAAHSAPQPDLLAARPGRTSSFGRELPGAGAWPGSRILQRSRCTPYSPRSSVPGGPAA